jgi:hypothetical protein
VCTYSGFLFSDISQLRRLRQTTWEHLFRVRADSLVLMHGELLDMTSVGVTGCSLSAHQYIAACASEAVIAWLG